MPNTTWNPADRINATLSGGDLIATPTGQSLVRSLLSVTSGKYYFEGKFTASGNTAGIGIANSSAAQTSISNGASVAVAINDGTLFINGAGSGVIGGVTANGSYGVAFDMGAKLIWFRGSAGLWNSATVGTANPATGVGGLSFSGLTGGAATMFAYCGGTSGAASVITGNFGDSAFVGVAPVGFASGLPGAVASTQGPRIQVLA